MHQSNLTLPISRKHYHQPYSHDDRQISPISLSSHYHCYRNSSPVYPSEHSIILRHGKSKLTTYPTPTYLPTNPHTRQLPARTHSKPASKMVTDTVSTTPTPIPSSLARINSKSNSWLRVLRRLPEPDLHHGHKIPPISGYGYRLRRHGPKRGCLQ